MGRDMGPILEEIRQLKEECDAWQRVSERLVDQKVNALSRLQIAEKALRSISYNAEKAKFLSIEGAEDFKEFISLESNKALEQIQKE